MTTRRHILTIDQGTTSSRAIIFNDLGTPIATAQKEFTQIFPHSGWVEHKPEEIWSTTLTVCREVLRQQADIVAIGITNQRETTLVWDRKSGRPMYNAIVWQDRRTVEFCDELRQKGHAQSIAEKTGLLLDPYFSASKLKWILDNVEDARRKAEDGALAFGTIDTFLLWRLTAGATHATDATNASRTMLFNIHSQCWDRNLLELFDIPATLLPEVRDCADDFGTTDRDVFGRRIPIFAVAGDQQAAAIGQACVQSGMIKSTYGTGCFVLLNTGGRALEPTQGMLTTVAYRLGDTLSFALEGSIFIAGAAVQWLRDGLQIIESADETESIARSIDSTQGVYLVPAFTGLGAPHWDPHARGALFGLTRDTGIPEIVRATLESVCYQTLDLINAMIDQDTLRPSTLRVDGGMVKNDWVMQFLADVLDIPVERPKVIETTALGVAYLACLGAGIYASLDDTHQVWQHDRNFEPSLSTSARSRLIDGWRQAVARVKTTYVAD
ncbi:MAG: glycerol kinase GlpK [Gammaproteobacteria bacterium]|nr:glycerol kinase GlpK [Gammaproteobacteria bacterium]